MGKAISTDKVAKSDDLSQKLFVGTMLSMSWQMAIAVLVPTVGGYQLDNHFKTAPYLTLIGLTLAVVGSVLIIRNALKELNVYMMADNAAPVAETKATTPK
ncbi:MAG: AtpZ/AtpI family protein [Patescibacteria group bacterium]|nr:AtpZ/AtpI family protein [Patescibacteria group bacterium]